MLLEEYFVGIIFLSIFFGVFSADVALLLWIFSYIPINLLFYKNKVVKYFYDNHQYIIEKKIKTIKKPFRLCELKSHIINTNNHIEKKINKLSLHIRYKTPFGIGLVFCSIYILQNTNEFQTLFWKLFNSIILLTTILFYAYKPAYCICVKNEASIWYENKLLFCICYLLFISVFYIITIAIVLHQHPSI